MRWLAVAVLIAPWAWVGWQNSPRLEQPQAGVLAVSIMASLVAAFWFGRRSGRASAVAVAMARADARAAAAARSESTSGAAAAVTVNFGPRMAEHVQVAGTAGLDRLPWAGDPVALVEQDAGFEQAGDVVLDVEGEEHVARVAE